MRLGKLRHFVELQQPVDTQDPNTGEMTTVWTKVRDLWAAIEPLSAREFIQSASIQAQIQARITTRYHADIQPTCRIVYGDKIYNIHGILADKESGIEYLTLPCSSMFAAT